MNDEKEKIKAVELEGYNDTLTTMKHNLKKLYLEMLLEEFQPYFQEYILQESEFQPTVKDIDQMFLTLEESKSILISTLKDFVEYMEGDP